MTESEFHRLATDAKEVLREYENNFWREGAQGHEKVWARGKKPITYKYPLIDIDYNYALAALVHALDPITPKEGEAFKDRVKRVLNGKNILEVGSRGGIFTGFLRVIGAKAIGIEKDAAMVEIARISGVPTIGKTVQELETKKKYDAFVSNRFDARDWINDPAAICQSIGQKLKKRGRQRSRCAGKLHEPASTRRFPQDRNTNNPQHEALRKPDTSFPVHVSITVRPFH